MAAIRLVDAGDQAKFLKFFEGAIYRNQSHLWILAPSQVKEINRTQNACGIHQQINKYLQRSCQPVAACL